MPTLVILGAPRSGTNLLRDMICTQPGIATWPCDEINPIWRHGNRQFDHDQIPPEAATPDVVAFIRRAIVRQRRRSGAEWVVEKTCANTLRVPFVDHVLPDAFYVNIVRDGREAALSAATRWNAPFDLAYSVRKARFVPLTDLGATLVTAFTNRAKASQRDHPPTWGPVFPGMRRELTRRPVVEVAAMQWSRCVTASVDALDRMEPERLTRVRYEDLVRDPRGTLLGIMDRLGQAPVRTAIDQAVALVQSDRGGRWSKPMPDGQRQALIDLLRPGMEAIGRDVMGPST